MNLSKSLSPHQIMDLARSKGKSNQKNNLRLMIQSKSFKRKKTQQNQRKLSSSAKKKQRKIDYHLDCIQNKQKIVVYSSKKLTNKKNESSSKKRSPLVQKNYIAYSDVNQFNVNDQVNQAKQIISYSPKTNKIRQNILTEQIKLLKQYITYLEQKNNQFQTKLLKANVQNKQLSSKQKSQKQSTELTTKSLQKTSTQFSICLKPQLTTNQSQQKQKQQEINYDQNSTLKLTNNNSSQVAKQSTISEQQITKKLKQPFETQIANLKNLLASKQQQYKIKEDKLKLIVIESKNTIKKLMEEFKKEQHLKKQNFHKALVQQRKMNGIQAVFS